MTVQTYVPIPRVKFIDMKTGEVSREWYRFFIALVARMGGIEGDPVTNDNIADTAPFTLDDATPQLNLSVGDILPMLLSLLPADTFTSMVPTAPTVQPEDQFIPASWCCPGPELDVSPARYIGTLGEQNADRVNITGGSATGLTGLSTNGTANVNLGTDTTNSSVNFRGSAAGVGGGAGLSIRNNNVAIINLGNKSAVVGGAYDATPYLFGNATIEVNQNLKVLGGAALLLTSTNMANGAAAAVGTLNNAPAAGNPTKWVPFNDNGTVRHFPAW